MATRDDIKAVLEVFKAANEWAESQGAIELTQMRGRYQWDPTLGWMVVPYESSAGTDKPTTPTSAST